MYISGETSYAVVTGQGNIKNVMKTGGHHACFYAAMLTNKAIKATFSVV